MFDSLRSPGNAKAPVSFWEEGDTTCALGRGHCVQGFGAGTADQSPGSLAMGPRGRRLNGVAEIRAGWRYADSSSCASQVWVKGKKEWAQARIEDSIELVYAHQPRGQWGIAGVWVFPHAMAPGRQRRGPCEVGEWKKG
ncbi:hypothetical protein, partial [Achromobacter xylosoxidans]|uniref:hypothetical protein n=1 Tax=Alcaligenes xylosoxydans xylosoxydans TaxID=85698 RepID=UPI001F14862B